MTTRKFHEIRLSTKNAHQSQRIPCWEKCWKPPNSFQISWSTNHKKDYEDFRNTLCVPDAVNVSEGIAQMTDQSQEWFQVRDDHTCLEAKMIQAIPATFMSKVLGTGRKNLDRVGATSSAVTFFIRSLRMVCERFCWAFRGRALLEEGMAKSINQKERFWLQVKSLFAAESVLSLRKLSALLLSLHAIFFHFLRPDDATGVRLIGFWKGVGIVCFAVIQFDWRLQTDLSCVACLTLPL